MANSEFRGNEFPGINSFKFFLAYKGVFMVRDEEFYQGMKQCAKVRGYCSLSF